MLPAQPEGGPYTLRIVAGNDAIEFDDVLIGEVWLAGGQSNMELELRNSEHADEALEDCADPLLRFYNVPKTGVINRNAENTSSWQESSPENGGVMSAVAYYFARKLRSELDPEFMPGRHCRLLYRRRVDQLLDERGRTQFQRCRPRLSDALPAGDRRQDATAVRTGNQRMGIASRRVECECRCRARSRFGYCAGKVERTVRCMPVAAAAHAHVAVASVWPLPRHAGTYHAVFAGRFSVVSGRGRRAILRFLPRAARHDDRRMACAVERESTVPHRAVAAMDRRQDGCGRQRFDALAGAA